jgi:peptidoglycan/LPS O-acetylase OafA/YrhL
MKSAFSGDSSNLDLVRAAAVLCVFSAHFADWVFTIFGTQRTVEETTWHFGQIGVLMFFVHTSFVLMLSLERQIERPGSFFRDFYIRRAFRIYPLSMFCVSLAFVLNANVPVGQTHWSWPVYLANMSLTENLFYMSDMVAALWTLPLEVQMYILLPFLFLASRARPVWFVLALWLAAVVLGSSEPYFTQRLGVLEFAPCFVAGVVAWRLSRSATRLLPGSIWPVAFLSVWPIFFSVSRHYPGEHLFWSRWVFCLALGLIIPWFRDMRLGWLNSAARILAKYSYGIYLSHGALLGLAFAIPVAMPIQILILAIGMAIVPFALFHFIEQPLIEIGRRIVVRVNASNTPATAAVR